MHLKLHPDPSSLFGNEGMGYLKQSGPRFMLYNDTLQLRAFKTFGAKFCSSPLPRAAFDSRKGFVQVKTS